jgi:hypothetical protein
MEKKFMFPNFKDKKRRENRGKRIFRTRIR